MNKRKFTQFIGFFEFIEFLMFSNSKNRVSSRNCVNFLFFVFCFLLFALSFLLYASSLQAKVTGNCSNCHTMHYSQGGGLPPDAATGGPWPVLLLGSCMGCHSNTLTDTIKTGNIPVVWTTVAGTLDPGTAQTWSGATYNLAGGNFYYVGATGVPATDHPKGHNIEAMYAQDTNLAKTPPGYLVSEDPSSVKYSTAFRLTCAGSNGCHGDRNVARASYSDGFSASFAGIKGAHHGPNTLIDGSTTAKSYRFLGSAALTAYSVLGREDADWQQSASVTDHNEYQGALTQGTTNTISYLCGHCHGNFHASTGIGTASPWLRHPTDTDVIAKGGEYANYNNVIGDNAYSLGVPVGYVGEIPGTPRAIVTSGDSPVICLSCHRAHASPYFKIMRWDYKSWPGSGGTNGCNVCHTSKN